MSSISALAHFAYRAKAHVTLFSSFPTKLKLRFFKSSPEELAAQDSLLRRILPLTKKTGPVHTLETARALAHLGGRPGDLSNALWQARGDEFSMEKADYGYLVVVSKPVVEAQIEEWASAISSINTTARQNSIEKLDAAFIGLTRAAEAANAGAATNSDQTDPATVPADQMLNELIDAYFCATSDPSAVVAGNVEERQRRLAHVLGGDFHAAGESAASRGASAQAVVRNVIPEGAVYPTVARLLMSAEWPTLPSEELSDIAHTAAQFLAGIGTMMMPAKRWRDHSCWGKFKDHGDFDRLEDLVTAAVERFRTLKSTVQQSKSS